MSDEEVEADAAIARADPGAIKFRAFQIALSLIRSLRKPVELIRRRSPTLARQIEASASSAAGNLLEGNRREGGDRLYHFRVSAGSADETRGHVLTAEAWGWLEREDIAEALDHADHLLAILHKLTR